MDENWHDGSGTTAQVRDDDDIPDDWESEPVEKPKPSSIEEKESISARPKTSKKSSTKTEQSDTTEKVITINESKQEGEASTTSSKITEQETEYRSLDNLELITREEFLNYSSLLSERLNNLSSSEFYLEFMDHFLSGITKSLPLENVRRLSAVMQATHLRKQSDEREKKAKSKVKKQIKPQLKSGRRADYGAFGDEDANDFDNDEDYDDDEFM